MLYQRGKLVTIMKVVESTRQQANLCGFMVYFHMREFMIYQDDNDNWVAECEELPGYRATGKTKDEALQKIKSALLIYHPCRCED